MFPSYSCSAEVIEHATSTTFVPTGDLDNIPWVIDNKYYTATVNYQVLAIREVDEFGKGPPALIYVFPRGKVSWRPARHVFC
jgi:hypothetical protein